MGFGLNQFPPLNPCKGYEWYDEGEHRIICPLRNNYDEDDRQTRVKQLEQLGGQILGEIDVPLDFQLQFIAYKLPDWLRLSDDHDRDEGMGSNEYHRMFTFVDAKDRQRLRVACNLLMPHTNIWTKYHAHSRIKHVKNAKGKRDMELWAMVQDLEKMDPDLDGDDDEESIIWEARADDRDALRGENALAVQWLNEHYPDWRNPTAYWT